MKNIYIQRITSALSGLISSAILLSSFPVMLRADELHGETKYYSVENDCEFAVNEDVVSTWNGHANINMTITNTGDERIDNWYITFDFPYIIENPYNSQIVEHADNVYTLGNSKWNQDIEVGKSVTIGFTASSLDNSDITSEPTYYILNTKTSILGVDQVDIHYQEYSDWSDGYTGAITISNASGKELTDWSIDFNSNRSIGSVSAALITQNDNGSYTICNDGNNQNIASGGVYQIGVSGGFHDSSVPFEISDVSIKTKEVGLSLYQDANGNGVFDYLELMESVPTVTPTPEITPSVTPEITPSVTPEISPTVTPTPTTSDILDSDQDGLADSEEIELGTDLNDADTDDDGLNDYIDLMLEYDPLNRDSNANGISDGDEDYDSDGLANLDEFVIGTFIGASDSDYDNLSDGDEVNTYGTNPLIFDTDDDGVGDGEEIILGKNPADSTDGTQKVTQTLTKEINNSEDGSITSVEITMATSRVIDNVVSIKDMYNKDTYSMNAVGRIGSPLKFDSDEEFDTAKVVIHYDETLLNNANEADLGALWYDEESGFFIKQNQAVIDTESNTVTIELSHFSTYILVDEQEVDSVVPICYDIPLKEQNYDFYFALDVSQRMTLAAREEAITTLHNFIGNMRPGDRIGIVYFDTRYALYGSMTSISDDVEIQQMLEVADINLRNGSLGGDYGSYVQAFGGVADMISQTNDIGNKRTAFVLTNDTECYFMKPQVSQLAANYGFTGNIVLMANTPQGPFVYGSPAARAAGGTFYEYGQSSILWDLFYAEHGKVEDFSDSDDDGLADFMEEQGMRTTNGLTICTLANLAYSDADTLPDGIEMGQMYTITNNEGIITIKPDHTIINDDLAYVDMTSIEGKGPAYIFAIFSNPTDSDTDFDDAADDIDATPRDTNQPINYIIYGEDNANQNTISDCFKAYKNEMEKRMKNDEIETIYIQCGGTDRKFERYFWEKMNHEYLSDELLLDENTFGEKIAYTYVKELIIISHGAENGIAFGDEENIINIIDINSSLSNKTPCRIESLDIEACSCAQDTELSAGVYSSVAKEFIKSPMIDNVYAWKGTALMNWLGDYNYSDSYDKDGDNFTSSCGYYVYWKEANVINEYFFINFYDEGWMSFYRENRTAVPLLLRRES